MAAWDLALPGLSPVPSAPATPASSHGPRNARFPLNQLLHTLLPLCEMFFLPPVFLLAPHSSGLSLNVIPSDKCSLTPLPKEVPPFFPHYILFLNPAHFKDVNHILCLIIVYTVLLVNHIHCLLDYCLSPPSDYKLQGGCGPSIWCSPVSISIV